jgi:anti-sigma B factor antagonist
MSQFSIQTEDLQAGVTLVTVKGFLDAYTYEQFEKIINDLFEKSTYKIVVDLSELQYISSAGAGVFIGAIGTAQENSGNIVIMRPNSNVREVFELLGLSQIFTFSNTREEAVKSFA